MLHDILLALGGHPGDLIHLVSPLKHPVDTSLSYTLESPQLPHLHKIECQEIENIVQVGAKYLILKCFVEEFGANGAVNSAMAVSSSSGSSQENHPSHPHPHHHQHSLYQQSIASTLNSILSTYLQHLTKLEQRCLRSPILSLSYLRSELEPYALIFQHLVRFCDLVRQRRLKGGELLDELEERARTGVPLVKRCFEKILEACYGVLVRNLMSWMVYGHLNAVFDEFFIESDEVRGESDAMLNFTNARRGFSHRLKAWNTQYTIKHHMLPKRISLKLAEKILFIGKAIKILQDGSGDSGNQIHTNSIPQKQLYKYSQALKQHEHSGLKNMMAFEYTINSIRASVAKYLWNLIVVDSDFMGQLNALRDYYLLGKGDLFHAFIEESRTLMYSPPSKNAANDVRILYQEAVQKSTGGGSSLGATSGGVNLSATGGSSQTDEPPGAMSNFEIVFQSSSRPAPAPIASHIFQQWIPALSIQCRIKWPLHLLFHKKVLARYNALFQFLFSMKRLQQNVQTCWIPLLKQKTHSPALHQLHMHFHRVRAKLSFLIDNLLYYLQVDVIDANFQKLTQTIASLKDFDSVRRAHNNYLASITTQCFLNSKEVKEAIRKIFDISVRYITVVENDFREVMQGVRQEADGSATESNDTIEKSAHLKAIISDLDQQWDRQSNAFFQILSNVKMTSPHLTQLLLRLDFNRYFSDSGRNEQQDDGNDEMED